MGAKVNKNVSGGMRGDQVLPWYAIFEGKGESIDVTAQYPTEKLEVTPENWEATIWEPLVDLISTNYAKNACLVVVEVIYINSEGNERSEPIFFKWCPDSGVPVRVKMLIGSSLQSSKKKLDVQGTTPEISQRSQLEINAFAELAKLKGWVSK